MKFEVASFETIKIWPEVGRKSIDLSEPSKKYELGQRIHAINLPYLLVVYPEKGFWILKSNKRRNYCTQKRIRSCLAFEFNHPRSRFFFAVHMFKSVWKYALFQKKSIWRSGNRTNLPHTYPDIIYLKRIHLNIFIWPEVLFILHPLSRGHKMKNN